MRTGINLGDALHEDGAFYGDGINVAARLESLAEPSGICIFASVHEHHQAAVRLLAAGTFARFCSAGKTRAVKHLYFDRDATRAVASDPY